MTEYKTAAVLACAGSGNRMKGSCADKLLYDEGGTPVAAYALMAYDKTEGIDLLVIVTQRDLVPVYQSFKEKYEIQKNVIVTVGGASRMESVLNGVRAVPEEYTFVAIGDGARPLIHPKEIRATLESAWKNGAAALGVHLTDTVKEVDGDQIVKTIPREALVGIQTPQVFQRVEYLDLAARAAETGENFTDDASIYEYYGKKVAFVEGSRYNMKITLPEDLVIFRAMLEVQNEDRTRL
ncbi:MAG: 2-C-methyl-D-erythritol 4-phosphate cytidylyltransferase [Clostridia bacterium]|nr:2-C-methyl-D-erythritol 4-phosphate cytidylyltransferase [Clostridia bacterium]